MTSQSHSKNVTRYVGAHGVAQLLLWSGFYYLLPALSTQIVAQTGWPVLHISMTFTTAFVLWALTAPLVGMLIDAGHGAKIMRVGAFIGVGSLIAISLAPNMWVFSFCVVLLGICMAATLYDPCFSVMLGCLGADGPKAIATVTLIAGFATLVTFPLVIGLSSFLDWQQIMQIFAALALVGMVLLPKGLQRDLIDGTQNEAILALDVSIPPVGKEPVLIALSFGLVMMGHAILVFLLPVALSVAGENANASLLALAILGPAQIAGRTVWRYFGSAVRPQDFALLMFSCLCLPALILMLVDTTSIAIYAALIIQGACYGVHTILRPNLTQCYVAPAHLGRALGFVAMVGLLMMAAGPAVGGMVWTFLGMSGLLIVLLILNGSALLLGLVLRNNGLKDATL